jgi:hypothetical protein
MRRFSCSAMSSHSVSALQYAAAISLKPMASADFAISAASDARCRNSFSRSVNTENSMGRRRGQSFDLGHEPINLEQSADVRLVARRRAMSEKCHNRTQAAQRFSSRASSVRLFASAIRASEQMILAAETWYWAVQIPVKGLNGWLSNIITTWK